MIAITGASDGLGKALAKQFLADGKTVVNLSRSANPSTENIPLDLTDPQSIELAAKQLLEREEPIEVFINCAGVISFEPLSKLTAEELQRVFATNIMGAMQLTSLLIDRIKESGGDIVNIASTVGTKAYENQAAYGASKWAMRGFSQNLQLELKQTQVRVLSICVGGFMSDLNQKAGTPPIADPEKWMKSHDIAVAITQMLALPKNMEISEVLINRK